MRKEEFAEVFGEINEEHILKAREESKKKKSVWVKWGAIAACLCLVVVGAFWGANRQPTHQIALQYNEVSSVMSAAPAVFKGVTVESDFDEVSELLGYNIGDAIPSTMKSYDYKYTIIQNKDTKKILGAIIEGRERGESTERPGFWLEISFDGAKPLIDYVYDYDTLTNSTINGIEVCATIVPEETYTNAEGEERTDPAKYTATFEQGENFYYIDSRGALEQVSFDELVCTLIETVTSNYAVGGNNEFGSMPNFSGTVAHHLDTHIIVVINDKEELSSKYTSLMVPLEVEIKDSYLDCVEGDEITIYYDGNITEGEPTLVDKVYAITLKTPANENIEDVTNDGYCEELPDIIENPNFENTETANLYNGVPTENEAENTVRDNFSIASSALFAGDYACSEKTYMIESEKDFLMYSMNWSPTGQSVHIGFMNKEDNAMYLLDDVAGGSAAGTINTVNVPSGEYYVIVFAASDNTEPFSINATCAWKE